VTAKGVRVRGGLSGGIARTRASTTGHDAVAGDGRTVEIKATYGD
jgi:hypothetical protein